MKHRNANRINRDVRKHLLLHPDRFPGGWLRSWRSSLRPLAGIRSAGLAVCISIYYDSYAGASDWGPLGPAGRDREEAAVMSPPARFDLSTLLVSLRLADPF